jgi:hypothetical protein
MLHIWESLPAFSEFQAKAVRRPFSAFRDKVASFGSFTTGKKPAAVLFVTGGSVGQARMTAPRSGSEMTRSADKIPDPHFAGVRQILERIMNG